MIQSSSDQDKAPQTIQQKHIVYQEEQFAQQPLPQPPQPTAAKNIVVTALYDYEAQGENELSLVEGSVIQVLTRLPSGWWNGVCGGKQGWFPFNFVSTPVIIPAPLTIQTESLDRTPSESSILASANAQLIQSQNQLLSRHSHASSHSRNSTESSTGHPSFIPTRKPILRPNDADQNDIDLPPNWGVKATADGRIYYYNLHTDETRWTLPEASPLDNTEIPIAAVTENATEIAATFAEDQLDVDTSIEWTWPGLTNQIIVHIHLLATAVKSSRKDKYVPATSAIVDSIRIMLYASGTPKRDSPILAANKTLRTYHRQVLFSLAKLVLAAKTASGVWPPPDAAENLLQINNDVLISVRHLSAEAAENNIKIHQIDSLESTPVDGNIVSSDSKCDTTHAASDVDEELESNALPSSAELLSSLEGSMKKTMALIVELADPVQVRTLRIKSPEPGEAPESKIPFISHTSLFSIVRSILKEVGNFFELIDDIPLDSLSNDLTVDFKVNRLALTNAISGLVTSTGHATNALLVSNAIQDISAAANLVEKSVKELLISTKFLIEEKESVEQMTLQTYIDQHNQVNRPSSADLYARNRRAMSMSFSQAQNISQTNSHSAHTKQEEDISHSVPLRGLTVSENIGERIPRGPRYAIADSTIIDELDDPAFSVGGRRTSKLRKILGEDAPPIIKLKPDIPWYLQYDYGPNDIILNMENNIRGGTLEALVEKLTLHDSVDANFVQCFLITYKSFTNSVDLVKLLERRFLMPQPEGLTNYQLAEWKDKKLTPIRLRVFNVLKSWFENYLGQEQQDIQALMLVRNFAEFKMSDYMEAASSQLIRLIDRRLANGPALSTGRLVAVAANRDYPQPILPKNIRKFRFLDLDPLEVARQLTIKEGDIFVSIQLSEFLNKAWSRKDQPELGINVNRMSSLSNRIIAWVGATILGEPDLKKRAKTMTHFILVAEKCFSLNNYSSLMNIIGTLDSAHVHRLKKTWELVSSKQIATYESLRETMSPQRNFINYRNALHSVNPPAIPFVGCYLTDLTFIADGNPDTLKGREHIINFAKMSKTAETLRDIQQFQHIKYALHKVPEIQEFLDSVLIEDATETEFYDMSLKVEPRNT
ncbi:cell division cycle- protein, variant 2 [Batrachochytrium dendrobatidis]|nr:cell division cycle- protein, variant 2 [Batrachochytrium dendrobatidis]